MRTGKNQLGACPCCGRHVPLTFHHLIPRKLHRRQHFRSRYTREFLARGVYVCRPCHNGIHDRFDEMTLGKRVNTLDAIRADEDLQRHFAWVAKQKISH